MPNSLRKHSVASTIRLLAVTACSGDSKPQSASSTANGQTAATHQRRRRRHSGGDQTYRCTVNSGGQLLALAELPAGFSIDKDDSGDGGADVSVSSMDARCARLVALTNADHPPGSKASANRSYSAGAQGPFIDESLDPMGSPVPSRPCAAPSSTRSPVAAR
ncbi:hypothetical protein ACFV9C_42985 [Kribbella sp. NPDC059898]|uniref:hypothetical protein n=1 Tax=Kribbella sp. NPDC059898 TaxID=3346995 RepID=UPI00364B44DB